jgi:hypothetical protein
MEFFPTLLDPHISPTIRKNVQSYQTRKISIFYFLYLIEEKVKFQMFQLDSQNFSVNLAMQLRYFKIHLNLKRNNEIQKSVVLLIFQDSHI